MKRLVVSIIAALAATLAGPAAAQEDPVFQGFVEGEFVWVGLPVGGIVRELAVERGEMVKAGDLLFRLNDEIEQARLAAAADAVAEARARLKDRLKGLRESEIDAIRARLGEARAERDLAVLELERQTELRSSGAVSEQALDRAKTRHEAALAAVKRIEAELVTAGLAARPDEIRAFEAALRQAEARLEEAGEALALRRAHAAADGLVFDTFYWPGEAVPADRPVVSLLPPGQVKLRFFVNETALGALRVGQAVEARCDGCGRPVLARISYISPRAEFTPPVIFSEEVRDKLVFLVEARPVEDPLALRPGQPVDVRLK